MDIEDEARAAMEKHGLNPLRRPMGDGSHTDAGFTQEDGEIAELAFWIGDLFSDISGEDPDLPLRVSYWYAEMTSHDQWMRVARALRIHGLKIVNC